MYQITLTQSDRQAIDWIGDRYANGHDLFKLLWAQCEHTPSESDWDSPDNITFLIPEHTVRELYDSYMFEGWSCFSDNLMCKFYDLFQIIV